MNQRLFHTILLIVFISVVFFSYFVQIDDVGVQIYGFKWHFRHLNKTFTNHHEVYDITKSFYFFTHGQFKKAFSAHFLGPIIFTFIVLQIPYRIWAIAISPKPVGSQLRCLNSLLAGLLLATIYFKMIIELGRQL